jgi:hypothetical protein
MSVTATPFFSIQRENTRSFRDDVSIKAGNNARRKVEEETGTRRHFSDPVIQPVRTVIPCANPVHCWDKIEFCAPIKKIQFRKIDVNITPHYAIIAE